MANKQGYKGNTYIVPVTGGWNSNKNFHVVPLADMTDIRNMNMQHGGLITRGGVSAVNGTVISGAVQVMGGHQFRLKNGNTFIVTGTTDGKLQKDYNTELKTGLTTGQYTSFETFENKLYICNSADIPQTWDGTAASTTNLSGIPTDWTSLNYPKKFIKHGKGVSESLWAFGCPSNPESLYVSANGTDNFADAVVTKINIEEGYGFGIVDAVEYGDNFICFGKKKAYIIDDSSATRSNWGYTDAQWDGGAAHARAICKTPNDLIVFDENLELYSVTAVQAYGDYKAASLTRPAYINKWMDENVDETQVDKFHIIYDTELRAVKWFVVRNGQTKVDTALVFFVDKGAASGWVQHRYAENVYASCLFPVRVSAGDWKVYTGGYNGYVYQLETDTFNDNGIYYYNGFTIPYIPLENPRITKHFNDGWLVVVPQGTETIKIRVSVDGITIVGGDALVDENSTNVVDENGNEIWGDSATTYEVAVTSLVPSVQNLNYYIGATGYRLQTEVYNDTINTSFFVSQQMFDFEMLEAAPQ